MNESFKSNFVVLEADARGRPDLESERESPTKVNDSNHSRQRSAIPGRHNLFVKKSLVIGAASIISGIVIWAIAAYLIGNQLFLVGPVRVVERTAALWRNGTLQIDLKTSGLEFAVGLVSAIVVGIPVGVLVGMSQKSRFILQPWISGFYSTPVVALSPLIILWFGIGLLSKVVVIFSVAVFPIIANTQAGVSGIDPDLVEMVGAFDITKRSKLRHLYLRGSLPLVLTGIRLAVGRAVVGVVVAELFGARSGLGYLIQVSSQAYDTAGLFSAVVILALLGVVLSSLAYRLERMSAPWLNR